MRRHVERISLPKLLGMASQVNGGGISQPSDEGSVVAMTRALKAADMGS